MRILVGFVLTTLLFLVGEPILSVFPSINNSNFQSVEKHPFRYDLKVASDEIASKLDGKPKKITISKMVALVRPWDFPIGSSPHKYKDGRILGFENQIWMLHGQCTEYRLRQNGTIVLILTNRKFEEVEVRSPDLSHYGVKANRSVYAKRIMSAHNALLNYLHPTVDKNYSNTSFLITVTGFGYYGDPLIGNKYQNGAGIEPILSVSFK